MPQRVKGWMGSCKRQLRHSNALEFWRLAHLCLMWCIWREMNAMSFKDCETAMLELKKMLFHSLYTWIIAFNRLAASHFSEFLEFCSSFSIL
jgi:hypothetical protein